MVLWPSARPIAFVKEMESMTGFLLHVSLIVRPGGISEMVASDRIASRVDRIFAAALRFVERRQARTRIVDASKPAVGGYSSDTG